MTTAANEPFSRSFSAVARGWAEGRVVELVYDPGNGTEKRTRVQPKSFLEPDAALRNVYLIAYDEPAAAMHLQGGAIRSATLTQDRYEIPDGFDPDAWLANSWGIWSSDGTPTVRIRLPLRRVDRAPRPRGGVASLAGARRAARRRRAVGEGGRHRRDPALILSWGRAVEVLRTPELRKGSRGLGPRRSAR